MHHLRITFTQTLNKSKFISSIVTNWLDAGNKALLQDLDAEWRQKAVFTYIMSAYSEPVSDLGK